MALCPAAPAAAPEGLEWRIWLPLLFIVFALLILLLVPIWVGRRADTMRRQSSQRVEVFRARVAIVKTQTALMAASTRGYVLTGDEQFREDYRSADALQDSALADLIPVARSLDSALPARVAQVRSNSEVWEAVTEDLLHRHSSRELYMAHLPRQKEQFQALLASIAAAERALDHAEERNASGIQRIERLSVFGTAALAALVILATLLLFSLARRFQDLAMQNAALAVLAEHRRMAVEEAMAARAAMIRGVSHDVRNPIAGAVLSLDLVQEEIAGPLNADQQAFLTSARRSLESASSILSELLDLAQSEAGSLRVERFPTEIGRLVFDCVEEFRAAARAAELTLEAEIAGALPVVATDPLRVRRILDNLLSNAIKYTPAGGDIRVRARYVPTAPLEAAAGRAVSAVAVEVRDTGLGIPPEAGQSIFEEFYRIPGTPRRGTGIGLAISRKIARLLGGEITVESEAGGGSAFTLWVPASEGAAGSSATERSGSSADTVGR